VRTGITGARVPSTLLLAFLGFHGSGSNLRGMCDFEVLEAALSQTSEASVSFDGSACL
jgi:hypothetical protein